MQRLALLAGLAAAALVFSVARGGHEFPVYPSYYPHEIRIATIPPDQAADPLLAGKIQAYVGAEPRFAGALPDTIKAVESLGAFVVVRVNPASTAARDDASACALGRTVVHDIAARHGSVVFHPYPITPFQGDYLFHVDQADAAKQRFDEAGAAAPRNPKVRATGALAKSLVRPQWLTEGADWDATVEEVSAAGLTASATLATNGWVGPPWARTGWYQAALLLADSIAHPAERKRVDGDLQRLETGAYEDAVARVNLERDLLAALAASCRAMVAGYTVKREYVNVEYSAGIENIGFDALQGLDSPMFIRTAKLKDFPWNGWLSLGTDARPAAAWNPVAGFTDKFGRLLWAALGDPALIPGPGDERWTLNRISDVRSSARR